MDFHDRLLEIMDRRNLKQVDICELTGLSSAQANHLVSGRTKDPKLSTAIKIADALGVSLDYLAGRESPPSKPAYSDARQQRMNEAYEQMSDLMKDAAAGSVVSMLGAESARGEEAPTGNTTRDNTTRKTVLCSQPIDFNDAIVQIIEDKYKKEIRDAQIEKWKAKRKAKTSRGKSE